MKDSLNNLDLSKFDKYKVLLIKVLFNFFLWLDKDYDCNNPLQHLDIRNFLHMLWSNPSFLEHLDVEAFSKYRAIYFYTFYLVRLFSMLFSSQFVLFYHNIRRQKFLFQQYHQFSICYFFIVLSGYHLFSHLAMFVCVL